MGLLTRVGLQDYQAIKAVELPYGRKRALEIATTLALEPGVAGGGTRLSLRWTAPR